MKLSPTVETEDLVFKPVMQCCFSLKVLIHKGTLIVFGYPDLYLVITKGPALLGMAPPHACAINFRSVMQW